MPFCAPPRCSGPYVPLHHLALLEAVGEADLDLAGRLREDIGVEEAEGAERHEAHRGDERGPGAGEPAGEDGKEEEASLLALGGRLGGGFRGGGRGGFWRGGRRGPGGAAVTPGGSRAGLGFSVILGLASDMVWSSPPGGVRCVAQRENDRDTGYVVAECRIRFLPTGRMTGRANKCRHRRAMVGLPAPRAAFDPKRSAASRVPAGASGLAVIVRNLFPAMCAPLASQKPGKVIAGSNRSRIAASP